VSGNVLTTVVRDRLENYEEQYLSSYWQAGAHRVQLFPAALGDSPGYCCQTDWQTLGTPTHNVTRPLVDIAYISLRTSTVT